MAAYWQALRSFSPGLRRFLIGAALAVTSFFGIIGVLQNLFLLRLGYDARFIGLALGIGQLVWAAGALPAGMLGRRIGPRNNLMLGWGISALGVGLLLTVQSLPANLWDVWIIGCQGLSMLGAAFAVVSAAPYMMATTREEERKYAFSVFAAIIPASAFVGSLIAGVLPGIFARALGASLDDPEPYRLALAVGPVLYLMAILPLFGADQGKAAVQDIQQGPAERTPVGLLTLLGAIVFLGAIGEGTLRTFFNVYLDAGLDVPPSGIGAIMGAAQLLPIVAALSAPLIMLRLGTGNAVVAAALTISGFLLAMAAFPVAWVAGLCFMGALAALSIQNPSRDLFAQELVNPRWRTTVAAVVVMGLALGWATAGLVGGYLIEAIGFGAMFFFGAITGVVSAAVLVSLLRTRRAPAAAEIADAAVP